MTIGEKGQHQNISREQSFMNSNEQNGKVDGSAQRRLLISDVKWDPQKKQWQAAGPQQYAAIQENHDLQGKPRRKYRCRRKRKTEEDGTHPDEQRLLEQGQGNRRKNAVGRLNLLMLADSAEFLLESGDNCKSAKRNKQYKGHKINFNAHHLQNGHSSANSSDHTQNPVGASRVNHNVEAEKTAFPLQGKIRLTQLRRQARSESRGMVLETQESQAHVHVDPKSSADAQDVGKVAADQVQEMTGRQDVEALLAKCYSQLVDGTQKGQIREPDQQHDSRQTEAKVCEKQRDHQYHANPAVAAPRPCQQIDFRKEQACIVEPLQDGQQQQIMPHHVITHHPMQVTNGLPLWPDKSSGPSMKQQLSVSQQEQVIPLVKDQIGQLSVSETQLPLHETETQKDHRLIARERRKLRTHRRKKLPKEQLVHTAQPSYLMPDVQAKQMYEAGQQWHWHMWNFHNWRMWEEQQRALQNVGKPLNGHQFSEGKNVVACSQHPQVVTMADHNKSQLEVNNDPKKYTIIDFQRDQSVDPQNHETPKAHTEPDKTTSSVKVRTRVSHLKREARLRNAEVEKEA